MGKVIKIIVRVFVVLLVLLFMSISPYAAMVIGTLASIYFIHTSYNHWKKKMAKNKGTTS